MKSAKNKFQLPRRAALIGDIPGKVTALELARRPRQPRVLPYYCEIFFLIKKIPRGGAPGTPPGAATVLPHAHLRARHQGGRSLLSPGHGSAEGALAGTPGTACTYRGRALSATPAACAVL